MKAIDVIKAMVYDSALAEKAQIVKVREEDTVEDWCKAYFDATLLNGGISKGYYYLCVWSCDLNDVYPFQLRHNCDAELQRIDMEEYAEDDREIYLWRIDNE